MVIIMTLWIGNGAVLKRILKINNSWTELFNFQNSFNCHLRTFENCTITYP